MMEHYNTIIAEATKPTILRLGSFTAQYGKHLKARYPADSTNKWQDLARQAGVELTGDDTVGRELHVRKRDVIPGLGLLATLSVLGESTFAMPQTVYGQQCAAAHVIFPQEVDQSIAVAVNVNYRMFTSGYAEVRLGASTMPDANIRSYIEGVWGKLALDAVTDVPDVSSIEDTATDLGVFQIGPQQVEAVGVYIHDWAAARR